MCVCDLYLIEQVNFQTGQVEPSLLVSLMKTILSACLWSKLLPDTLSSTTQTWQDVERFPGLVMHDNFVSFRPIIVAQ